VKPIKIIIAVPHKFDKDNFTELTTFSIGIFRRLRDKVDFHIANNSEFKSNFCTTKHYTSVIFTTNQQSVLEISKFFAKSDQKPIIKNLEKVKLVENILSFHEFQKAKYGLNVKLIYNLTKNIAYKLQNNMNIDLTAI